MRRLLLAMLCGAFVAVPPAGAQTPACVALVGFGGVSRTGDWTPVAFTFATNSGPSTRAEITLIASAPSESGAAGNGRVIYRAEVEIPRNSSKTETLYARCGSFDKAFVRYAGYRPQEIATPVREVAATDLLIVVVGGSPGLLKFLDGQPVLRCDQSRFSQLPAMGAGIPSGNGSARVEWCPWVSLPRHWLGWEAADVVVLGDDSLSQVDPETVQGLVQWVRGGGVVFVPGGVRAQVLADSALAPYLPFGITGTTSGGNLGKLAAWVGKEPPESSGLLAEGAVRPGATGIPQGPGSPIIASRSLGAGRVVMARFDPFSDPMKGWSGTGEVLARAFAETAAACGAPHAASTYLDYMPRTAFTLLPARVARQTPEARLPSIWLVVGFLVIYILVLSPVNYLLLKRVDRRELAWLTTPAIVAVFTVGAYGIGYGIRGGTIVFNRVSLVDCVAGQGLARATGYMGLFSPTRRTYDIDIPHSAADDVSDSSVPTRLEVLCGDKPLLSDVSMNMWSTRAFSVEMLADLGKGLDGVIEYDGRELSARVRNNTGKALRRAMLLGGGGMSPEETLHTGSSARLRCLPSTMSPTSPGYGPPTPDATLDQLLMEGLLLGQQQYASHLGYYGPSTVPSATRWPCVAAICDAPLVPARLRGSTPRTQDCNLLVANLPVRIKRGASVDVPHWLIPEDVIHVSGDVAAGRPDVGGIVSHPNAPGGAFTITQGRMTVQFRVPTGPAGQRVMFLRFAHHTQFNSSQTELPTGMSRGEWFRAWNCARGVWEPASACAEVTLDGTNRTNFVLRRPQDFMSEDGRVTVQISVRTGRPLKFENLRLAAKLKTR